MIIARILNEYFYLRQRLPIFVYLCYLHFRDTDSPIIDKIINACVIITALVFSYSLTGLMFGIPFSNIIPFDWNYSGLLTWGVFFFIYYYQLLKKTNRLTSFTMAVLATVGGGWLYEISFWHPLPMFVTHYSLFYLNGQIMCLILLAYEFRRMRLTFNGYILSTLSSFLMFSWVLATTSFQLTHLFGSLYMWVYRIPTCLLLISLLSGVE